ncbi:MAG: hypothetical protein ACK58L_01655 [Planctomycetota bacterium]
MSEADVLVCGVPLSARDMLRQMYIRGILHQPLNVVVRDQIVQAEAARHRLAVDTAQLQHAADEYRRRNNLHSADATLKWIKGLGINVAAFERRLEVDLLTSMLKDVLFLEKARQAIQNSPSEFDLLEILEVFASRDDLAQELRCQLLEQTLSLAELFQLDGVSIRSRQIVRSGLPMSMRGSDLQCGSMSISDAEETEFGFRLMLVKSISRTVEEADAVARVCDLFFEVWMQSMLRSADVSYPMLEAWL